MNLVKLEIESLFGRFDYSITFDKEVNIITGPNGYGKTTILKIINAFFNKDFIFFKNLEFKKLSLKFSEEEYLFEKKDNEVFFNTNHIVYPKQKENIYDIHTRYPWLRKFSNDLWLDIRNNQIFNNTEINTIFISPIEKKEVFKLNPQLNDVLNNKKSNKRNVCFIREQRLFHKIINNNGEIQLVDYIKETANKLKKDIKELTNNYYVESNKLDSTYHKRLFSATDGIETEEEYKKQLTIINNRLNKLKKYNLLDNNINVEEQNYNKEYARALKIYFDDLNKKYDIYSDFLTRLDLFTELVNDKLYFKKINISNEKGISVICEKTNKEIRLDDLSSGEKQELILFYKTIFETKDESLLLIDEPEISLHIAWQRRIINDFIRISEISKFKVIIATHSPQIISDHWDLQKDLQQLYEK